MQGVVVEQVFIGDGLHGGTFGIRWNLGEGGCHRRRCLTVGWKTVFALGDPGMRWVRKILGLSGPDWFRRESRLSR
jgi:hypothetical protein